MAEQLLLHSKTKQQITDFLHQPSHALLITGQPGSGKETLARYLSARLAGVPDDKLDEYPYFIVLTKPTDKQEISIDSVRQLIHALSLKPAISKGGQAQKLVFINGAHQLSEEAQNALLKAIEEPPPGTVLILSVPSDTDILPTIASRAQTINVAPISQEAARKYFNDRYTERKIDSAWSLSQGAIGLMSAILADEQDHPLKKAVDSAKSILKMNRYERILFLDSISGDKAELLNLLDALNRVLAALHQSAIKQDKGLQSRKLITGRKLTNKALEQLKKNTSVRLICLNLAVNLPV
jgi:replication-associated recombination protein RarA